MRDHNDSHQAVQPKLSAPDYCSIVVITALACLLRVFYLHQPVRYDEALSYYYFYGVSLFQATHSYLIPNNHVLYSVLSFFSTKAFGVDLWTIRLVALVFGCLAVPLAYLVAFRAHSRIAGVVFSLLLAGNSYLVEYSTNGRGYTLFCFCALVYFLILPGFARQEFVAGAVFVAVTVAGAYTIPVMLLPAGGFLLAIGCLWLTDRPRPAWGPRLYYAAAMLSVTLNLVLILYFPIVRTHGRHALTASPWVEAKATYAAVWRDVSVSCTDLAQFTLGRMHPLHAALICVLIGYGIIKWQRYHRSLLMLMAANGIFLLAFVLLRKVFPPARVMIYWVPPLLLLASVGMASALERLRGNSVRGALLFLYACWIVYELLSSDGILASKETGTLANQEEVIRVLEREKGNYDAILAIAVYDFPLLFATRNTELHQKLYSPDFEFGLNAGKSKPLLTNTGVFYFLEDRRDPQSKSQVWRKFGINADFESGQELQISSELSLWRLSDRRGSESL